MYGKIINGELVYAPLNYKTSDGTLITNFNTNEDLMIQHGFKKISTIEPNYDKDRECIIVKSFEESADDIKVEYEVKGIGALLNNDNLSKDELIDINDFFTEKDLKTAASDLYPLDSFSVRKDENIQKGYVNGRYGAIPFIRDIDLWLEDK